MKQGRWTAFVADPGETFRYREYARNFGVLANVAQYGSYASRQAIPQVGLLQRSTLTMKGVVCHVSQSSFSTMSTWS